MFKKYGSASTNLQHGIISLCNFTLLIGCCRVTEEPLTDHEKMSIPEKNLNYLFLCPSRFLVRFANCCGKCNEATHMHAHVHAHTHMHAANSVIVSRLAQQPCGKYDCLLFSTGNLHQQDACFSPPHLFPPLPSVSFAPPPLLSLLHLFHHLSFLLSLLNGNMLVKQPQLWKNRCVGKENSVGTVHILYV